MDDGTNASFLSGAWLSRAREALPAVDAPQVALTALAAMNEAIDSIEPTPIGHDWQPIASVANVYDAVAAASSSKAPELSEHFAAVGRHLADDSIAACAAAPSATEVIEQLDLVWRNISSSGTWAPRQGERRLVAALREWAPPSAHLCSIVSGWLGRIYERSGRVDVVVEHSRCRLRGADACRFEAWGDSTSIRSVANTTALATAENVATGLFDLREMEQLAPAICGALCSYAAATFAAIYVAQFGGLKASCVAAIGDAAGPVSRVVVNSAGLFIGRFEMAFADEKARAIGLERAAGLARLLGPSLDRARLLALQRPTEKASAESDRAAPTTERDRARLRAAQAKWKLTRAEGLVLQAALYGYTNREIATALHRAEATVEIHMTRLLKKSGAANRGALLVKFWRELRP